MNAWRASPLASQQENHQVTINKVRSQQGNIRVRIAEVDHGRL